MTTTVLNGAADLDNPTGRRPWYLNLTLAASCTLLPPGALLDASSLDPAQSETADLRNHSASVSERMALEEPTRVDEDLILESPGFTPPQLTEFRARSFERRNRWV